MSDLIHYETPDTGPQIAASLVALNAQCNSLWRQFSDSEFFAQPSDGGWSPAQNVVHLIKSTSPITRALGMPRFVLRLLFGKARIPSRTFTEVRAAYRAVLASGGQAGSYGPPQPASIGGSESVRKTLLERWESTVPQLSDAMGRWDEEPLDYYRLPHPLLGKLTVREMLYFTLYHVGHHAEIVAARRPSISRAGDQV
jgi:hypothetical protein